MSIVNLNIPSEVSQTITDGVTDKAPSENAVYDALGLLVPKTTTISHNGVELPLSGDVAFRSGLSNTGVLSYVGSTQTGAKTITFGALVGIISDNETDPEVPTYTMINYVGETSVVIPTIGTGTATYVFMKRGVITGGIGAGELFFQNTEPTSEDRKEMIYMTKVSHPNLTSISFAIDEVDFVTSPLAQLRDWTAFIQYMKKGMDVTGNAGLTVNLAAGQVAGNGINFVANPSDPTYLPVSAQSPLQFFLQNQSGAVPPITSTIDPLNYDVGGVTTAIGGGTNRSTIQYLRYAPGVGFSLQRGQTIYASLTDAIAAVGRESFVVRPNLVNNSILVAVICLRHTTTDMNDTNYVRILPADKFGQIGGAAAGISVTTLQSAYNNSIIPQFLIDATHGALTKRSGMALNTDIIEQWQNIAGTTTASITGAGALTVSALTNTSLTPNSVLFAGTGGLVSQENGKFKYNPTGYNSNAHLLINATAGTPTARATAQVTGSDALTNNAFLVENSSNVTGFRVAGNGNTYVRGTLTLATDADTPAATTQISANNILFNQTGTISTSSSSSSIAIAITNAVSVTATSSGFSHMRMTSTFSPASGNATYVMAEYIPILNQSVSSTGASYGIVVAASITRAYNFTALRLNQLTAYTPNAAVTDYKYSEILLNVNASVANQVLVGLDIVMSGSDGAFAGGVMRRALRLQGGAALLAAGTTTYAPLVFVSGTNRTTPVSGGVEYNNTFHLTNSDAVRRHIVTAPNTTKVTAGAPYTNDGYLVINIGGTDFKFMTTA